MRNILNGKSRTNAQPYSDSSNQTRCHSIRASEQDKVGHQMERARSYRNRKGGFLVRGRGGGVIIIIVSKASPDERSHHDGEKELHRLKSQEHQRRLAEPEEVLLPLLYFSYHLQGHGKTESIKMSAPNTYIKCPLGLKRFERSRQLTPQKLKNKDCGAG